MLFWLSEVLWGLLTCHSEHFASGGTGSAKNLGLWEQIRTEAQNGKQLMSTVTPQYLKEPVFFRVWL